MPGSTTGLCIGTCTVASRRIRLVADNHGCPRSTRGAAGDADFSGFIKSVFWIVNGRRAQMQSTCRSVAERTSPAFGCIRFKVTDVTEPGGSFHVVAWALQTNRSDRSISAIAQLPFRHYAYGLTQRQAEVCICMKRQVFLDPSAGKGIIFLSSHVASAHPFIPRMILKSLSS
jgi:hypothetical protein